MTDGSSNAVDADVFTLTPRQHAAIALPTIL
jgi:hypothetical protein